MARATQSLSPKRDLYHDRNLQPLYALAVVTAIGIALAAWTDHSTKMQSRPKAGGPAVAIPPIFENRSFKGDRLDRKPIPRPSSQYNWQANPRRSDLQLAESSK